MRKSMLLSWIVMTLLVSTVAFAQDDGKAQSPTASELSAQGEALTAAIHARVAQLLADSPHPLFTRHLRSTDALVRDDWARASLLLATEETKEVVRTLEFARKILDGLNGDAGNWEGYADGARSLSFAFVSGYDQSVQQYQLRLPRDWDPQKSYPVIVYLHGHVPNVHPLWYASLPFSPAKAELSDETRELEPHFSLAPWGRGNTGYRNAGETDVWEVMADAKKLFNFDPDRMYLTGHSMGAFGTWAIGVRTPDVWAGMAMYAGGSRYEPPAIEANLAHMPLILWHGAKDRTVPMSMSRDIRDALAAVGNEAIFDIDPEAGHMVPRDAKKPHKKWLLEHRRSRPDRFSFLADTTAHRGAWGVRLSRPQAGEPLPFFSCEIDGNTVRIDSRNADGLDVNLGEGGLDLTGEATVIWNGEQAYRGPVETVTLGKGAGRSRWGL